jgi:hypothetical protein
LSRFFGYLFNIIASICAGIAVVALIILFATWPIGIENKIKQFAQNRFLFSALVLLPLSLIATHLAMILTETQRNLPNYATVFAAVFGTLVALYAFSFPG